MHTTCSAITLLIVPRPDLWCCMRITKTFILKSYIRFETDRHVMNLLGILLIVLYYRAIQTQWVPSRKYYGFINRNSCIILVLFSPMTISWLFDHLSTSVGICFSRSDAIRCHRSMSLILVDSGLSIVSSTVGIQSILNTTFWLSCYPRIDRLPL